jgi:hypothetical protein
MRRWSTTKHEKMPVQQKSFNEYKGLVPIFIEARLIS